MLAHGTQFAVAVLRHLYKAVVIVIELSFVTIRQYLCHSLPAAQEATFYIILRNVMTATTDSVGDSCKALRGRIKPDIEQTYTIPQFFDFLGCGLRLVDYLTRIWILME